MLSTQQHTINSRVLTTFHSIQEELTLDKSQNYLFDLSCLAVLDLTGVKAAEFLQGQVSCDVRVLSSTTMIQGAQCNLKGRILALLDLIDWQGVKLIVPQDMVEFVQSSLTKSALLSRVCFQKNTQLKLFGFYLQNPKASLPFGQSLPTEALALKSESNYCCYHLGGGLYLFLIDNTLQDALCQPFIENAQFLGSLTWHTLMLLQKQLSIYPQSRGLFLPHRLGLHDTSAVSFNKGCYKGQEIIARMHYKSTLKHELRLFRVTTKASLYSGQKMMADLGGAEIGEVIDYSLLGDDVYLVAVSLLKEANLRVFFENHTAPIELIPA